MTVVSGRSRAKTPRISINGVFLDEVRTRLDYGHETQSVGLMSLPAQHHRIITDGDGVVLRLPAITALQLYYDGVLPSNCDRAIELKLGKKKVGRFVIESLRRVEGHHFGEPVLLRLIPSDADRT
jgi:hypothetical protein